MEVEVRKTIMGMPVIEGVVEVEVVGEVEDGRDSCWWLHLMVVVAVKWT